MARYLSQPYTRDVSLWFSNLLGVAISMLLTAIEIFVHHVTNLALVTHCRALGLQCRCRDVSMTIHGLLERIVLPAEHVVGVRRIATGVAVGPEERLTSVCWPICLVVEGPGIPDSLEEDLWDFDGVGRRAGAPRLERARDRIRDVICVVRRVQVDAVPAGREPMIGHNAGRTRRVWERQALRPAGRCILHAGKGQLAVFPGLLTILEGGIAHDHAEARLECGDLGLLRSVE